MQRILVTGATGQIGSELTMALRARYAEENVIAAGHSRQPEQDVYESGPYITLDVRDQTRLIEAVKDYRIDAVFHLASLLSAVAENSPQKAWDVNMNGLFNVLETARLMYCSVFFPSSIGAFGPTTPMFDTPQDTIQRPNTLYGVTKVSGELLCDYYLQRFAVDARGLRYPGLISYKTEAGGGTTDYAVEIFYAALQNRSYQCFLKPDTRLDMMYMPDAVNAAIQLMETDLGRLTHHNAFNVTAMSITPQQLANEIKRHLPDFKITYQVDPVRQAIADSWPRHMDDSCAAQEWGWRPEYNLSTMVADMLEKLALKFAQI